MDLYGMQSMHSGSATPQAARDPLDASHARDLYAAWSEIFDKAKSAGPATARSHAESPFDGCPDSKADATSRQRFDGASLPTVPASRPVRANPLDEPSVAVASTAARMSASARRLDPAVPMSLRVAGDSNIEPARNVTVRVHYVRPVTTDAGAQPPSEVVSVVLLGNQVSIVVRDTGLDDAEALRAAFQTAQELTGRPSALRQLTLNGRLLYDHEGQANPAAASSVLFSC